MTEKPTSAEEAFLKAYPMYTSTQPLDELRNSEYAGLDYNGHVYLDYTGAGLYAESQVRKHSALLLSNTFGNPHSTNPTSLAMTRLVEQTRAYVFEFFNASPDEYEVIFTLNASGALKLVGESYPFGTDGQYLLTFDNHNSVNGIREFARAKGAKVTYAPVIPPDLRIDEDKLLSLLDSGRQSTDNLFAFPAQSNFSGVQHNLEWIKKAQEKGWDVLLDAAAYAPSNKLDLSQWRPEYVTLSFYKMFGYPTGVGCLIARKEALTKLHRPWFAGGTISLASVQADRHYLHAGSEGFEDGTLNYLALPAVQIGLQHLASIGMDMIHTRVSCLTGWLVKELCTLQHSNGTYLVQVYGPLDSRDRGGTVTFNFYDPDRNFIDHRLVERRANEVGISLRTGCFCNPGGGELALGISAEELSACMVGSKERLTFDDFRRCIDAKSTGAVRVSLGLVSSLRDLQRFLCFARWFKDIKTDRSF